MFATLAATLLLGTAGPAVVTSDPATAVVDPKKMSQAEIRAHNATLPRTHPNYIRCVRSAAIGSLVARNYSCRTVAQWDAADRAGNDEMRRVADAMASKATNTN
ncbi:MAG: hypothetical protein ACKOW1_01020 [Novosphingobium sp.]|jgi:hypothetical protein